MTHLESRLRIGRELLEEGDFFRILTHYDVDGICSAGIVASYLLSKGKKFHVSFFRNADREELLKIANEEEYVIFTDLGSSLIGDLKGNVLILDHHKPPRDSDEVVHINPHLFGYDGAIEATATTMAYLIADDKKYAPFFLAGLLGDKQYIPGTGPIGLNREIIEKLRISVDFDFPFYGSVSDALFYSVEPFFPGISGNRDNIEKILEKLGIEATKNVSELNDEEKIEMGSYLSLNLIKNSKVPEAGKFIVDLDFKVNGLSVRYLTELLDSACRTDNQGVALAYILGERTAFEKMEVMRRDYRGEVINEMYAMLENIVEEEHVQYFYSKSSYLASTTATIGTLYLLDPKKVTLAMHMDSQTTISARIHRSMMHVVDLGKIMHKVAEELGGHGGGHSVAAGASIPRGTEEEFVKRVNQEVAKVLFS